MLKRIVTLFALTCCVQARKNRHQQAEFVIRNFFAGHSIRRNTKSESGERDFYARDSMAPVLRPENTTEKSAVSVREDILQALKDFGLDDVSASNPAVSYMLEVYRNLEAGDSIPKAVGHRRVDVAVLRADTIRGLPAGKSNRQDGSIFLTFNLSNIARHEVTKKAELRLHIEGSTSRFQKYRAKVRIFRDGTKIADLKYTVKSQREAASSTDIVDLTPVLQTVIDGGYGSTIIEVKLRRKSNQLGERARRFVDHSEHAYGVREAILVLFTRNKQFFKKIQDNRLASGPKQAPRGRHRKDGAGSRAKRASQRRERTGARQLCQKYDFMIDFAEIGWDKWIIYPKKYNAFYCMGRCPTPVEKSYDPTNHAILQGLLRMADKTMPRPCCIPTKLRALSMLYYEYNEIIVRQHKDMIANSCGCR